MTEKQDKRFYDLMNGLLIEQDCTLEVLCMNLLEKNEKQHADLLEFIGSTNKEKREKEAAQAEYQKLHGMFMELEAKAVALETEKGKAEKAFEASERQLDRERRDKVAANNRNTELKESLEKVLYERDEYKIKYEEAVDVVQGMQETLTYLKRRWAVAEEDIKSYQEKIRIQHNEKRILTETICQLSREALSPSEPVRFPNGVQDVREILADVPDTWVGEQNG